MSQWLTIEQLAKQEGISVENARKRAQRGQYERRKDGRRTLYRIFTAEQAEAAAEEKEEVSAQAAFLAAKAEKMQLDAERAKVKLHQEKMLLYDDVFQDETAWTRLFCALLGEGVRNVFPPEQSERFKAVLKDILDTCTERHREMRKEYAAQIKSSPDVLDGYKEYKLKKLTERKAAEEERKAKREAERKKKPIETLRADACHDIFGNDYLCKWYVEIKNKSTLTDAQTNAMLEEWKERFNKLAAHFTLSAEKITTEAGLQDLIKEYQAKRDTLTAETLKKGV